LIVGNDNEKVVELVSVVRYLFGNYRI